MTTSMQTRPWLSHTAAVVGLTALSLAGVAVEGAAAPVDRGTSPHRAACAWKIVSAPSPGTGAASLRGVDAISPKNVWAVGGRSAAGATLVEHWNGKTWKVVPSPNRSTFTQLEDVAAVSAKNVWAVGFYVPPGTGHPKTLIEHWNGKRWSVVPSPNPLKGDNVLFGVDAVGKSVYAVGANNLDASAGSKQIGLRLVRGHFRVVKPIAGESALSDVAALPNAKAVAVGHHSVAGLDDALVEQRVGSRWQQVPSPTSATGVHLRAVSAAKGVQWAVGQRSGTAALQTTALRRGAGGWAEVDSENSAPTQVNLLHGVVGLSKTDAWSVGYHENPSFTKRTLIEHFSGGSWSIVNSPNKGTADNELLDVTASRGKLWAVGYSSAPLGSKVMVQSRAC